MSHEDTNRKHDWHGRSMQHHVYSSDDLCQLRPYNGELYIFKQLVIVVRGACVIAVTLRENLLRRSTPLVK